VQVRRRAAGEKQEYRQCRAHVILRRRSNAWKPESMLHDFAQGFDR
jgi:hypothetical protein